MFLAEMCVAAGHRRRAVAEDLHEFALRRSVHRHVRGRRVPQIVKFEVLELGFLDRFMKGFPDEGIGMALCWVLGWE